MPATRRQALAAFAGIPSASALLASRAAAASGGPGHGHSMDEGGNVVVGEVDHEANGFTPAQLLTEFDYGEVSVGPDGRPVRHWTITAVDKEIEIAPGVFFPAWTYDGRVPGPALRCVEGERLRITLVNGGTHAHTIHLHSIHPARMDGIAGAGLVEPGQSFTYEVEARPFGCHFYHCHAIPLKRHIHKGLYGALIIDPDPDLHPGQRAAALSRRHGTPEHARWQEFIMVMNGFDTNFDEENEFYAINSIAFAYASEPIRVSRSRPVRVYLMNATEFDPVNSLHLHGNFYDYYDHGTTLTPTLRMVDTVMQCQGQRGILEIDFSDHEPGLYMFHAHQSEFAELGWMSFFEVTEI